MIICGLPFCLSPTGQQYPDLSQGATRFSKAKRQEKTTDQKNMI